MVEPSKVDVDEANYFFFPFGQSSSQVSTRGRPALARRLVIVVAIR